MKYIFEKYMYKLSTEVEKEIIFSFYIEIIKLVIICVLFINSHII